MRVNKILYWLYFSGLGLALLYLAINKGLTGDETGTVAIVNNLTYMEIFQEKYLGDFNPFGFFILNKIAVDLIDIGSVIYKVIPILFYIGSVYILYKISYLLSKDKSFSLINTVVFSLLPLNLFYALFDRAYSYLSLTTLVITYLTVLMYKRNNNKLKLSYVAILSTGMYIHFFVGLFTAILFILLLIFKGTREDIKLLKTIFWLNIISLVLFIPELLSLVGKFSEVAGIVQEHANLGFVYKFAFTLYGSLLGMTLSPINSLVVGFVGVSIALYVVKIFQSKEIFSEPGIQFSLLFIFISVTVISMTGFARPMYVIFILPFISYIIALFFYKYNAKLATISIILLMLWSNYNFFTSSSKYYVSPQDTINYKYYYGEFLSKTIEDDSLIIISPSYNKSIFDLYSKKETPNVLYINPYIELDEQFDIKFDDYGEVLVFHEFQSQDVFPIIDKNLIHFKIERLVKKAHQGFIKKNEYSYFEIRRYTK